MKSINAVLVKYVKSEFGPRCQDYQTLCACCKAWESLDYLLDHPSLNWEAENELS